MVPSQMGSRCYNFEGLMCTASGSRLIESRASVGLLPQIARDRYPTSLGFDTLYERSRAPLPQGNQSTANALPAYHLPLLVDNEESAPILIRLLTYSYVAMARRKPLGRLGLLVLSWNILYANVEARETRLLPGFDDDGQRIFVPSHRTPALYTGDFGDCVEENVMYGEQQFEMVFDPCLTQVYSVGSHSHTPSALDVIPSIAYQIPDFDGVARLQVFSNTTQTRIGCFQAALQNGQSLSHPIAIPVILAFFTTLAILSSFALAVYGTAISQMRTHYAHAFSGLIIFETFHSIFLSGAVSLPWPSVLPAWRSNFAWASGLVYAEQIVDGVASFAAAAAVANSGKLANSLFKRQAPPFNASNPDDYTWAGGPARPGLPLPGSHGGFAGTLAVLKLPTSAAFLVALVWFFVLLALVAASIALLRWVLGLRWARTRVDPDKVAYFRAHLAGYIAVASLRTFS
ncbi:unnamed protein product [Parascedosporium putredinis]|uniref:ML-like domain-containing protein n=1 Tax=Parascedosporium putredinis TaxID=1442378 RepID=A0A9P1M5F9_9PEZI|nr:unnamed protein product [Parascedosporium putredinis]CAI7988044.1 unnamed protein product [Parascedosporium putredinis]